jgi:hypothetical protein
MPGKNMQNLGNPDLKQAPGKLYWLRRAVNKET